MRGILSDIPKKSIIRYFAKYPKILFWGTYDVIFEISLKW